MVCIQLKCYLFTDVDIFLCGKCSRILILLLIIYWCWLFFICKMFLTFSIDVYVIFLDWNISMNCKDFIFICHLLMLAYLCVQNVVIIINWCLCYFLWLKHINDLLHLHLSFTDVDIFLCRKCSRISILLLIIYWYWLFFMCKMFLTFSIDVYVIFFDWNISMNCTHFTIMGHLLMLIYFCVLF